MRYSDGAHVDGLQQIVDALADRLSRSVAVDDTKWRLVTASRHFGDEDPLRVYAVLRRLSDPRVQHYFLGQGIATWTGPGRIPGNPDLDLKARVCIPVRTHGILFAFLFLIDEGVEDWEIELAEIAADEIGWLMYRRLVLHEQGQSLQEQIARDLVSTEPADRAGAFERLRDAQLLLTVEPVLATVIEIVGSGADLDVSDTALRQAVEKMGRGRLAGRILTTVRGRRASILFYGDAATSTTARTTVAPVLGAVARDAGVERVVAGVGSTRSGADAAALSHAEARSSVEAAVLLPSLGDIVDPDTLGVYAVLLRLPRDELTARLYPHALRRLMEQDTGELVDTLETYLDCSGDTTRTAAQLRVHRSTLYYRLGRIESLGAINLRDGQQRLELHLGVKLRRLLAAFSDTERTSAVPDEQESR